MEPRIYTYKITFPHQGWWYWGWHKEKKFGENYFGSPKTHGVKWDNFEWEMQILELFTSETEAQKVENRLIKPDLNNPNCLNEHFGSVISEEACSEGGKKAAKLRLGVHDPANKELVREGARKAGKIAGKVAAESGRLASIASKAGKIGGAVRGRQLAKNPSPRDLENVKSMQLASVKAKRSKWPKWAWDKVKEGIESGKWHWGAKDLISQGISPKQIANMQKVIKQGFSFDQAINLEGLK